LFGKPIGGNPSTQVPVTAAPVTTTATTSAGIPIVTTKDDEDFFAMLEKS
jgi:hypothetical protein